MNQLSPKYSNTLSILIGAGLIAWSYHMRDLAAASETWPSVPGEITVSEVTHSVTQSSSGGNKSSYNPRVEYRYEIDGVEYTNDRIQFASLSVEVKRRLKAARVIQSYPVGKRVDVFYDPTD